MAETFGVDELTAFIEKLFATAGFTSHEATRMAESLVLSEISGHTSHGLARATQYIKLFKKGRIASGVTLKTLQETPTHLTIDAQHLAGQVAMPQIMERLYAKLETAAVVTATVTGCGHIGRLGEWVERAGARGFAALLLVNDNGQCLYVAPPGGKQPVTSTNPIAFAIPMQDGEIFAADLSTSAIAYGKVRLARMTQGRVAENCLQDATGKPTTDPETLFTEPPGCILPMGGAQGYKGFALAMFVEMLVAGLSGGQATPADPAIAAAQAMLNNIVLTLWNPKFFAGTAHMAQQAAKFVDFVRSSPAIDPEKPIRLAGDRMYSLREKAVAKGITLDKNLVKDLQKLAEELNVTPPLQWAA